MNRVIEGLSLATLPAGVALATYAGYGIGLARTGAPNLTHWAMVAALLAGAAVLVAWGVSHVGRRVDPRPPSLSHSLAVLDTLAPALLQHADGREALQDLIEILVESACRSAAARAATVRVTTARATSTEGRTHA